MDKGLFLECLVPFANRGKGSKVGVDGVVFLIDGQRVKHISPLLIKPESWEVETTDLLLEFFFSFLYLLKAGFE